jgi:DmX-like protein
VATTGFSKNHHNVCLWDVLMIPNRSLVAYFVCHEDGGGQSIVYSPRHQLLISGGKHGDICM